MNLHPRSLARVIAGYHALQAGIEVAGLCEALPDCSGYKVHKDKLARLGVPIYVSHTVLSANGEQEVESVTIAQIDENWRPIHGTEQTFACDTVLVAVGLDPVDEFLHKAREFGLPVHAAGDAEEIAEAWGRYRQNGIAPPRSSNPVPARLSLRTSQRWRRGSCPCSTAPRRFRVTPAHRFAPRSVS